MARSACPRLAVAAVFLSQVMVLLCAIISKQELGLLVVSANRTSDAKAQVIQEKSQDSGGTGKEFNYRSENSTGHANTCEGNKTDAAPYTDAFGGDRVQHEKLRDISPLLVIEKFDKKRVENNCKSHKVGDKSSDKQPRSHKYSQPTKDKRHNSTKIKLQIVESSEDEQNDSTQINLAKFERQKLREERKRNRTAELIHSNANADLQMQQEAIEHSKTFDIPGGGKYEKWRRFQNASADNLLRHMKDQIILAKVYSSIARSNKKTRSLSFKLNKLIRQCGDVVGEADSDNELQNGALGMATEMGYALSKVKPVLYRCEIVARKLRAMVQFMEGIVKAQKKKSLFLMEFVAFSIPKSLHCLSSQLTLNYYSHQHSSKQLPNMDKIEDPSLYHYAIFSDNVLSTWVVVNSTVMNAKEPEKHVFHIVTDRLQFSAMEMWFIAHPLAPATILVESIDKFTWLNSSYCPVLQQLEREKLREFYFKAEHPSKLSDWEGHLKYKNPKYLSMLNHLRFYMPQLFPRLNKILFLDDDVVVQKDLTTLWSTDMKGMVNGAVETCKKGFHELKSYLNFSNTEISEKFDPLACGWAFGMNIFDLHRWRELNLTGVYHYWQDLNKDRELWSLGTLPPGLITFYNLTYPLDKRWHLLGLGYQPSTNKTDILKAAVIHYNGNNKPWLELGYSHLRSYWSKYVNFDDAYLRGCNFNLLH